MAEQEHQTERRHRPHDNPPRETDHALVAVEETLPGKEPTEYDIDLTEGPPYTYRARYWRCRRCSQERNRRAEFADPCDGDRRPHPLSDGGYSMADPRTKRALSEDMAVRFDERGSTYEVHSEQGEVYAVDVEAWTCTRADWTEREPSGGCKHLRRLDLEIRTGTVPRPDGTFRR